MRRYRVQQISCPCKTRFVKGVTVEWCEGCNGRGEYAVRLRYDAPEVNDSNDEASGGRPK